MKKDRRTWLTEEILELLDFHWEDYDLKYQPDVIRAINELLDTVDRYVSK